MKNARAGFTLIEMLIAVSLSSMVLISVVSVSTTMIRKHMEGLRRGSVTGWSLVSFVSMTREIERANVLIAPTNAAPNGNLLGGCINWSRLMGPGAGAKLDPGQPVEVFYYCYNPGAKTVWYYKSSGMGLTCPAAPPAVACDGSAPFVTFMQMAWNVELQAPYTGMFERDNSIAGVRVHYVVGEQTPTVNRPAPIFAPFDVALSMQKSTLNPSD